MALSASDESMNMNACICEHNDPVDEPVVTMPTHKQLLEEVGKALTQLTAAESAYEDRRRKTKEVKTSLQGLKAELVDCKRKRDEARTDVKNKRRLLVEAQDVAFNHPDDVARRKTATIPAVLTLYTPTNQNGEVDVNWSTDMIELTQRKVDTERLHAELKRGLEEYKLVAAASYDISLSEKYNQLRIVLANESREVVVFVAHQVEVEEDDTGRYPSHHSTVSLVVAGTHALDIDVITGTHSNGRSVFFPTERTTIPDSFAEFVPTDHATPQNDPFFRFLMFLVGAFPHFEFSDDAVLARCASEHVREIIAPRTLANPSEV